jgi:hypothetical protein
MAFSLSFGRGRVASNFTTGWRGVVAGAIGIVYWGYNGIIVRVEHGHGPHVNGFRDRFGRVGTGHSANLGVHLPKRFFVVGKGILRSKPV